MFFAAFSRNLSAFRFQHQSREWHHLVFFPMREWKVTTWALASSRACCALSPPLTKKKVLNKLSPAITFMGSGEDPLNSVYLSFTCPLNIIAWCKFSHTQTPEPLFTAIFCQLAIFVIMFHTFPLSFKPSVFPIHQGDVLSLYVWAYLLQLHQCCCKPKEYWYFGILSQLSTAFCWKTYHFTKIISRSNLMSGILLRSRKDWE